MPKIVAIGTAVPPHAASQFRIQEHAARHFANGRRDVARLLKVFENVRIKQRYFCVPQDWFDRQHSFQERNDTYVQWAERLSTRAIAQCLDRAGIEASQIGHLVFVSTSGVATPSIDARLINHFGFSPHVRRTPIFGLGCAGGAAGVGRAADLAKAASRQRILMVAVETSSLTFQPDDFSKSNLVASALFADGAAAVLISGDETEDAGVELVDSLTTIWPKTLQVMGWEFTQTGLKVVFSKSIPHLLARHIRENILQLLEPRGLDLEHLKHFAIHPGGAKVLESFQASLQLENGSLDHSRFILENFGNMSSPTMLFVLERILAAGGAQRGEYGLGAAFGPGFSSELLLLRWN